MNKTGLSSPVVFLLTVPVCHSFAVLRSFVCGFICDVCFVTVCSSSLVLSLPREGRLCFVIVSFPGYLDI